MTQYPVVKSLYWKNVSQDLVAHQKAVFRKLGVPHEQCLHDKMNHAEWMEQEIARADPDDILVFCDIDAFPITKKAYEKAVSVARGGKIFGLAQTANHLANPDKIYAGPMFLAFKKQTYLRLNTPSLRSSKEVDAAQNLTLAAEEHGVEVELAFPKDCLLPKWPLGNIGIFGIGTFYGDREFFHLFESRKPSNIELFKLVALDVVEGSGFKWEKYLQAVTGTRKRRKFLKFL